MSPTSSSTITVSSPAAIIAGKPIKSRDEMRGHLEGVAAFYNRLSGGAVLDQLIEWR